MVRWAQDVEQAPRRGSDAAPRRYFPNTAGVKGAPLLLWLQGGPGGASTFGALNEVGPLRVERGADGRLEAKRRETGSWAEKFDLLFLDNPVGTGFSYTNDEGGYARKREDYEDTLYAAMQQFYAMFPDKLDDEFYITGESYAGHYIPALAHKIHVENGRGGRPRVPLAGFAIGDGWSDPETMVMQYADMLYSVSSRSLVDREPLGHAQRTDN